MSSDICHPEFFEVAPHSYTAIYGGLLDYSLPHIGIGRFRPTDFVPIFRDDSLLNISSNFAIVEVKKEGSNEK